MQNSPLRVYLSPIRQLMNQFDFESNNIECLILRLCEKYNGAISYDRLYSMGIEEFLSILIASNKNAIDDEKNKKSKQ